MGEDDGGELAKKKKRKKKRELRIAPHPTPSRVLRREWTRLRYSTLDRRLVYLSTDTGVTSVEADGCARVTCFLKHTAFRKVPRFRAFVLVTATCGRI